MSKMSIQDLIAGKQKDMQAKKARAATLKPQPGKHKYRVLPTWRVGEENQFWHDFAMHFIKTAESGDKPAAVYVCTDKTFGKPCEVCEAIKKSMAVSVDDAMTKRLKDAQSAQRYLMNVLHLTGPEPTKVQTIEVGTGVFESICALIGEYGDITDLNAGVDILIERTGSGLDTKYSVMPAAKSAPVPAAVMSSLNDLDAFVSQENPAGETKALVAVGQIIGLQAPAGKPAALGGRSNAALASLSQEAEDADYTPVGTTPAAAEAGSSLDDDLGDLDDLLK